MAQQLTLDLPHRPALEREDFLVAPSNEQAVALVDLWPNWSSHAAVIVGEKGTGKTHLAHVWQKRAQAELVSAKMLSDLKLADAYASSTLVIEDVDPRAVPEKELFHLLNLARQNSGYVLLTSVAPPSAWSVFLPDLVSRLKTVTIARIEEADDTLLRAVLVKHFVDRQLAVDEALISYILKRMHRSLADASLIVAQIDDKAMTEGAEINRKFVSRVMREISAETD